MIKRVRDILDKQLEEPQSGFRGRRSCQDHIFTLKLISKKVLVYDQKIYMSFIDILKLFIVFRENKLGNVH